jgi:hypothetical protein
MIFGKITRKILNNFGESPQLPMLKLKVMEIENQDAIVSMIFL